MFCSSPREACPSLNKDGGGVEEERVRWKIGGRRLGGEEGGETLIDI